MTLPFLPDSAPFTPAQRAYLNGFFAGLLNLDPSQADASSGGSADAGGAAVAEPPEDLIDEDDMPWHDPSLSMDERMELTEDKPAEFKFMGAMAQLDCGACGYLCRTYSKAIADGVETDLNRCVPGGKETAKKLKQLVKENPVELSVEGKAVESDAGTGTDPADIGYDRDNPFPAPILAIKKLTREGSNKDVRFVALDLTGSGIEYDVGDALGVYPDNCTQLVDRCIDLLGMTGNEPVAVAPNKLVTLRQALRSWRTITQADEDLANLLAENATDEKDVKALRELAEDDDRVERFDLFDLLQMHRSVKIRPADLVDTLPPLQPRLYSISSSQAALPNEVHLTVAVVRYELDGRPRRGVTSTFFAERVHLGDTARIFIQKSHAFGPPEDGDTPTIMVGPGTGIAPFRAFCQQRQHDGAKGKNWLLFGDQRQATDFLYEHELTQWVDDGLITRLDTAFSRDQDEKIYVQHRMLEHGGEIWQWLEDGAHFYVCGDASRMAKDVDAALKQIIAEHGGKSADEAEAYVSELTESGRYQRDVY